MRAMCASNPDPASLTSQSVPVPDPGPGELLVEVRATAVTAGELTWPESWPAIPCHDLSGVVAATGDGVTGWRPGDEVYGLVGFDRTGAAAEYVTAPAADLAPKPASVDHLAAAAVPLGGLTAGRPCTSMPGCGPVSTSWSTGAPEGSAPTPSSSPRWPGPG